MFQLTLTLKKVTRVWNFKRKTIIINVVSDIIRALKNRPKTHF